MLKLKYYLIIIILLFVLVILSAGSLIFLQNNYSISVPVSYTVYSTETLADKSFEYAEEQNLKQIKEQSAPSNLFVEVTFKASQLNLVIQNDYSVNTQILSESPNTIVISKGDKNTDSNDLFNSLEKTQKYLDEVKKKLDVFSEIKSIEISAGLQNDQDEYNNFLKNLKNRFPNITLYLRMYPYWSDYANYYHYRKLDVNFGEKLNWDIFFSLGDYYKVELYGLVNQYFILPGEVSNTTWAEKVLSFLIYKGAPKGLLIPVISTKTYLWPEREVENNLDKNYALDEPQALIRELDITQLNESANEYSIQNIDFEGKAYTSAFPSKSYISSAIKLVKQFGIIKYTIE